MRFLVHIIISFSFWTLIFFSIETTARAANLYIEPSIATFGRGDTFTTKIRIDPQDDCINAVTIRLGYPANTISAIEVGRGESIFSLWVEDPVINREKGEVHFSAGIPGGYCGRIPGDPGLTNVVANVIFRVPGFSVGSPGKPRAEIKFLDGTEVLLNDGFGTPAKLIVFDALIEVGGSRVNEGDPWISSLRDDNTLPEPFSVLLVKNDSVFGGKYYVVFNALDKQSGIDHYEVKEVDIDREGMIRGTNEDAQWERTKSPYVLKDQSLNSIVQVRAFDKAGNFLLSSYIPPEELRKNDLQTFIKPVGETKRNIWYGIGLLSIILVIGVLVLIIAHKRRRKRATINGQQAPGRSEQRSINEDNRGEGP